MSGQEETPVVIPVQIRGKAPAHYIISLLKVSGIPQCVLGDLNDFLISNRTSLWWVSVFTHRFVPDRYTQKPTLN